MDARADRRFLLGALAAAVLIMLSTGAAVTAAVLLDIDDVKRDFFRNAPPAIKAPEVTRADAGDPRTFLVLGSDERYGDEKIGREPRSDTILLVRADPGRKVVTVMSVPRDLKVVLPGVGVDKINGAYEYGGPRAVLRAIRQVVREQTGQRLEVNHILNLDFRGFRRAVAYIGGILVDVDRTYFNDNDPPTDSPTPYATIDVKAGYQRLGGQDALDYVRYRHGDDDFVRAARQQDFLRQIKAQRSVRRLFRLQDRHRLAHIFGSYVQVDDSFRSTKTLLRLLKLGAYMTDSRVVSVRFPGAATQDGTYVEVTPNALRTALRRFERPTPATRTATPRPAARSRTRSSPRQVDYARGLEDARAEGRRRARRARRRLPFPFRYPKRLVPDSAYVGERARVYGLGRRGAAYRLVLSTNRAGEYYGVQGTEWRRPPILSSPDRIRVVGGRRLLLFYDGRRLRQVGWRTPDAAYWVSNTLTRALSNREMIGVAASLSGPSV